MAKISKKKIVEANPTAAMAKAKRRLLLILFCGPRRSHAYGLLANPLILAPQRL
jgi:hypothetical protein